MTFKKIFTTALIGLTSFTLVACGEASTSKGEAGTVKVGIVQYAEHEALDAAREGFVEALAEAGFKEGDNLTLDFQNAQGDQANLQTMVSTLAGKQDLNFAIATPAAQALFNADAETPSVFTAVTDPVAAGLVDSLEKPGTNMTGSTDATDVEGQIDLLLKVVPEAKRVGIFFNSSEVNSEVQAKTARKALEAKGVKVVEKTVTSTNDVQEAMTSLAGQVDAIYLPTDNTVASTIVTIGEVLKAAKVPAMGSDAAVVEGVLFTYGVDYHGIGQQAGQLAAKLLKGEKAADVPVEAPAKASIEVNEEMADVVGISPDTIQALAD